MGRWSPSNYFMFPVIASDHPAITRALGYATFPNCLEDNQNGACTKNESGESLAVGDRHQSEADKKNQKTVAKGGQLWPYANTHHLCSRTMFLDSHKQTDSAQEAGSRLEIPPVEVASPENQGVGLTKRILEKQQPPLDRTPPLTPYFDSLRARRA